MSRHINRVLDSEAYQRAKKTAGITSAEQLAKATGLVLPLISSLEQGIVLPDTAMASVARVLEVPLGTLVKRVLE